MYSHASSDEIPAAKEAVDKTMGKLETISARNLAKVRNKSGVIEEARHKGVQVHCASLMDICYLKNSELEKKHQKYKGRIVLRGDIVEDGSGSCAVFTEQGSSASQMTAAKVMDFIARLPVQDRQRTHSICSHSSQDGRCCEIADKYQIGMSRHLDTSTTTQMA